MQHGPGSGDSLSSLLSILNNKMPESPITSVVNATTIDLFRSMLYPEDYVSVATRLSDTSDVVNMLDFILRLLCHRRLTSPDATTDFNRRARRLMFKIISTNPVLPRSLIVTEVKVPVERDYIGGGAFGGICKGELCGEIVALKVLYRTGDDVAFCREALMWAMLKHEFVLSFLGIYKQRDEMFLVSPYMPNGTLAQWRKNANPSVNETRERMLEVAQGMEYIHSEGIVHGDLRGDNVLLDANLHVQIADFGLTRLLNATNTQSGAKHLNFSAPELFGCLEDVDNSAVEPARTQMSDVYAFGCLYYEIYFDSIPFAGKPEAQIITLAIRGVLPPPLNEPPLSDGGWEVIQQCWAREPWNRPRMKDVTESLIAMSQSMSLPTNWNTRISRFRATGLTTAPPLPPVHPPRAAPSLLPVNPPGAAPSALPYHPPAEEKTQERKGLIGRLMKYITGRGRERIANTAIITGGRDILSSPPPSTRSLSLPQPTFPKPYHPDDPSTYPPARFAGTTYNSNPDWAHYELPRRYSPSPPLSTWSTSPAEIPYQPTSFKPYNPDDPSTYPPARFAGTTYNSNPDWAHYELPRRCPPSPPLSTWSTSPAEIPYQPTLTKPYNPDDPSTYPELLVPNEMLTGTKYTADPNRGKIARYHTGGVPEV